MASGFQPLSGPDCPRWQLSALAWSPILKGTDLFSAYNSCMLRPAISRSRASGRWLHGVMFGVAKSRMYRASERVERRLLDASPGVGCAGITLPTSSSPPPISIASENTAESSETRCPTAWMRSCVVSRAAVYRHTTGSQPRSPRGTARGASAAGRGAIDTSPGTSSIVLY
jgi:hypothetical protein